MSSVLVRAIVLALILLAAGSVGVATAETEPELTITSPAPGSELFTPRPSFKGGANGSGNEVTVEIKATNGGSATTLSAHLESNGGEWSSTVSSDLEDGTYTATAREENEKGETERSEVPFKVHAAPRLVTEPVSTEVKEGETATFTASAVGEPTPTVQWQVSVDKGATWSPVSGATSNTLRVEHTTAAENGYEYRAVFTNKTVTTHTVTTRAATLTVYAPIVVVSNPVSTTVVTGENATFTASASGTPTPTVQWQVSSNKGGTWSPVSGATTDTLTVAATKADNGYEYEAVFTNKYWTATSKAATLTVDEAPLVTTNPANTIVVAGKNATFKAAASGNPTPTVQWQFSTDAGLTWTLVSGATSETLTITTTHAENGYEYEAVFTNSVGTATSSAATLTVEGPPAVTGQPSSTSVVVGETATFTAVVSAYPAATVQWEISTDSGSTWTEVPGATAETMTVAGTTLAQSGSEYRAVFSNKIDTVVSSVATLTVTVPPPAPAVAPPTPVASFGWFPASPHTGEPVQLASSSTDAASPITAVAWDLTGNGPFVAGGSVLTTSFSTPGAHVVRLRVTAANGLSSIATRTITVTVPPITLMAPFPVVRIAGYETSSGARLSLLSVQAPLGARITVTCRGHGCPTKSEVRVAVSSGLKHAPGIVVVAFKRFERSLRAGVVLDIRVWKSGEIGKYTSFAVRLDKLPVRTDTCLNPANSKPMACPAT